MRKITCGTEPVRLRISLWRNGIKTVPKVSRFSHFASVIIASQYERITTRPGKRRMLLDHEVAKL